MSYKTNETVYLNLDDDVAVPARFIEERNGMCFCRIKPLISAEHISIELAVRVPSNKVFKDSDIAKMTAIEEYKRNVNDRQDIVILAVSAAFFPDKKCERYKCMTEAIRQLKIEIP